MLDSFMPGAENSKNTPESGEKWLIPVDFDNQRTARVEVLDVVEDGAYIRFEEDTKVGTGNVFSAEFDEGEESNEVWDLEAFEYGKPLSQ